MRPPCETVVKDILPAFRALVARNLIENYSFTQMEVAKKLGTTQPAISYYLSSKRGRRKLADLEANPFIKDAVNKIAQDIVENKVDLINLTNVICYICKAIKDKSEFNRL